jgi:hypothetical protein
MLPSFSLFWFFPEVQALPESLPERKWISKEEYLPETIARKFHVLEAFTGKAFEGCAAPGYCRALITQSMEASGAPAG